MTSIRAHNCKPSTLIERQLSGLSVNLSDDRHWGAKLPLRGQWKTEFPNYYSAHHFHAGCATFRSMICGDNLTMI
ncbi:hypothetical protein K3175_04990 [Qipengyuania sp. GH1]|uniref:hypothetical protein n=1 Tax=Qipengyuania aestuarii TaxID=2867241 RepID=UPI001C8671F6|nr:hypothetical protein [Qipengyuania aestuarii]MBX7535010.1 hypothetical protein [Qipengyuania aestuarii]